MARRKKIYVLDTNVILHDSSCIRHFEEHDVVVPITVLEELDHFKKGNDTLNFHARVFTRELDRLNSPRMFGTGVRIADGLGRITIQLEREFHDDLDLSFATRKADHHILNIAYHLAREHRGRSVILVTKDVNLRMKARAAGLVAQDYTSDRVKDITSLYSGRRLLEGLPDEMLQAMYGDSAQVPSDEVPAPTPFVPNEFLIMRNHSRSALAMYEPASGSVRRVEKRTAYGIMPRNAEQTFAVNALLNPDIKLVTLTGKAGTGKTLLALASALEMKQRYQQVFMARPIVPLSNKDTGYLPGDIQSKLNPYMQPLYDNLGVIRNQFSEHDKRHTRINELLEQNKLVIAPLSYIRGRSLVKIFFIVDEAQNLTPHEVKTIITRAGEGTKIVLTGDIFQIDHPYLDSHTNGLTYLIEKMQGQPLYAHVALEKGERSELAEVASDLL